MLRIAACMTLAILQSAMLPEELVREMPLVRAAPDTEPVKPRAPRIAQNDEPVGIERQIAAVERDAFDDDAFGVLAGDEAAAAGVFQCRGTTGDDVRAVPQLQRAAAKAPGRQHQRLPARCRRIDGLLQGRRLVDRAVADELEIDRRRTRACRNGTRPRDRADG